MRKLSLLMVLLLAGAFLAALLLLLEVWRPSSLVGKPFSGFLAEQTERLAHSLKEGTGIDLLQELDRTAGTCLYVVHDAQTGNLAELPGQPFPFARPVQLAEGSATSVMCRFAGFGDMFRLNPATKPVTFTIRREAGKPGLVEIHDGEMYLHSGHLDTILRSAGIQLHLKSEGKAGILLRKDTTSLSLVTQIGHVDIKAETLALTAVPQVLQLEPVGEGTLTVNGSAKLEPGKFAKLLPSGLEIIDRRATAAKSPPAHAPDSPTPASP